MALFSLRPSDRRANNSKASRLARRHHQRARLRLFLERLEDRTLPSLNAVRIPLPATPQGAGSFFFATGYLGNAGDVYGTAQWNGSVPLPSADFHWTPTNGTQTIGMKPPPSVSNTDSAGNAYFAFKTSVIQVTPSGTGQSVLVPGASGGGIFGSPNLVLADVSDNGNVLVYTGGADAVNVWVNQFFLVSFGANPPQVSPPITMPATPPGYSLSRFAYATPGDLGGHGHAATIPGMVDDAGEVFATAEFASGSFFTSQPLEEAFRWTPKGGSQSLNALVRATGSTYIDDVTGDGHVLVSDFSPNLYLIFGASQPEPISAPPLPDNAPPTQPGHPYATISGRLDDAGNVFAFATFNPSTYPDWGVVFRWTQANGTQTLSSLAGGRTFSFLDDVGADGNVLVNDDTGKLYFVMHTFGVDVSSNQGLIDWPAVANAGQSFAIVRATLGRHGSDGNFQTNIAGAMAAGIVVGAYHVAFPNADSLLTADPSDTTVLLSEADREADNFAQIAGTYLTAGSLQPALDLEQGGFSTTIFNPTQIVTWVTEWIAELKRDLPSVQLNPILYMGEDYAKQIVSASPSLTNFPLWIAAYKYNPDYTPTITPWNNWAFMQFSDKGSVSGISENVVDLDVLNSGISFSSLEITATPLQAKIIVHSPVAVLIVDPQGRRLGYDPTSGAPVNDFGSLATDSGQNSEPETLAISMGSVVPGLYYLSGIGTDSGPYQIELSITSANNPNQPVFDQIIAVELRLWANLSPQLHL